MRTQNIIEGRNELTVYLSLLTGRCECSRGASSSENEKGGVEKLHFD